MEDYLASELKEGQYDLFANLAILKLFVYGIIGFKVETCRLVTRMRVAMCVGN